MKLGIEYDTGDGPKMVVVGVQAHVGWELRTKNAIGDLAKAFTVNGLTGLLFEQLRIDNNLPADVKTEKDLVAVLVDIDPAELPDARPTQPGAQPGSSSPSAPTPASPSTT